MLLGVNKPKYLTEDEIVRYANKKKLGTANLYFVKDTIAENEIYRNVLQAYDSLGKSFSFAFPDALVFDPKGINIAYAQNDSVCNGALFGFLQNLYPGYKAGIESNYTFSDFNKLIKPYNNEHKLSENSYKLVILWAVWTGRANKMHLPQWELLAAQNKKLTIEVIKLNMDFKNKRFVQ